MCLGRGDQARGQLSGCPARRRARRRPASSDVIVSEARVSLISLRNRGPRKKTRTKLCENAVGDGTYLADPDFEWEEEVEETKHGGS